VARLQSVDDALPPEDGVAVFTRMYLKVTRLVLERIGEGQFSKPAFATRLDIVFAGLFLDQLTAAPVGRAWAPLFERRRARCEPIQFALAGMNAHINHDLPIALVRSCRQLGLSPRSPGVQRDYDAVTGILAEVQGEVRQSFLDGGALAVDREFAPVVTLVGNWSIAKAREAAWVTAGVLWELRDSPTLSIEFLGGLGSSVGMVGRYLLTESSDLA